MAATTLGVLAHALPLPSFAGEPGEATPASRPAPGPDAGRSIPIGSAGQNRQQTAAQRSMPAATMPPPSAPVTTFAEAVKWLEGEAHRIIRASAVPMKDGTTAFPPQVGLGYGAFWLRDYAYALEGSIQSFSDKELTEACRVFLRSMRADGAGVDCVRFTGIPIYQPGFGKMGREPVLDGPPFTVGVAWHTYQRTKDGELLQEMLELLVRTMNYMPRNPINGLAYIGDPAERCSFGFTTASRNRATSSFAPC